MKNKLTYILAQIIFGVVLLIMFFIWAPWLASKPIDQVGIYNEAIEIPEWAKSFNVNHGEVVFRKFGTVSQEIVPFIAFTGLMIVGYVTFILLFFKCRKLKKGP